ncbi:MAG TPA: tetratricopeptide repeat protein [Flavobacteriia bacterium]|nr:tetratricopeptide repeat protein [Flavobacteriia bacterium]
MLNTKSNFLNKRIFLVLLLILIISCKKEQYKKVEKTNTLLSNNSFMGSETCKTCHKKEFSAWQNSHHDLSMQVADSTSVLGNFNNTTFQSKGIKYHFFKKGNDFYVNTEGEEGMYQDYKITYTFGVTPLQQYLIDFKNGKKQCLLVAWDAKQQKWYDLQPKLKVTHNDWLHWTGGSMTWNNMCADCHSTNLHKNYDNTTQQYNTTFSIINVSCEACHGPSSTHVDYYQNNEKYKDKKPPKLYMDTLMASKELVQKCARCHSRRSQLTNYFDYQGHYLDHYNPSKMIEPVYELDGQIKDEDYVYGSFVQSKMYHNGVSCKDCHNVHSLQLKKQGNALCLQCHAPKYNTPSHHFHKQNTKASLCVNCHMAGKTYMGIDFRRDHSFRIPRPDQSVSYGTPNACNQCHTDKSASWASKNIQKWYGKHRPEHFSDNLLAGYHGDKKAFYEVISNKKNPEIIRATAVTQYANQTLTQDEINELLHYVADASALVRNEVILAANKFNSFDAAKIVEPLLLDTVRLVRISAARYFNIKNRGIFDNAKYKKAWQEYKEELTANADFASGQHQLALYYQTLGDVTAAINAYEKALKIDNYYNRARINLALLEYNQGHQKKAEELYLKVIEQEPEYSYPYFMLGLLYNETGNAEKSLKYLALACDKQPVIPRAFYNYALKLQENKAYKKSLEIIEKALKQYPFDEGLLYVKLLGQIKTNQQKNAYNTCIILLQISPENTNYQKILDNLK